MAEWSKRIAHSCYGCPMYYSNDNSWYNTKHCGGNHYECDYFCNGGKPNVGVYAVSKEESEAKLAGLGGKA